MTETSQSDLLQGVRVLDLSQYIPGPYTSLMMARQGADVIKVEAPGGDPLRQLGTENDDISPLYDCLNRGKRIIELNLKTSDGLRTVERLAGSADVLLEGFRPGTLQRLGLDYARLREANPRLVICSISGFGQQGKLAQRAGHDLGYGARAGLYSQAAEQGQPVPVYPPVADHAAALNALALISAALFRRASSGEGCRLDVSIHGAVADWSYALTDSGLAAQLSGDLACYRVYQTRDRCYVTLAALELKFWQAFCTAVERPDWLHRHREPAPQSELIGELAALFGSRPLSYWETLLSAVDCCFESVPSVAMVRQARKAETPVDPGQPEFFSSAPGALEWRV